MVRRSRRTLKSQHLSASHGRAEIRIFARAFHHAAPARIARNVDHRAERPRNASSPRLACSHSLRRLHHFWIPRRCHRNGYRKNRVIPVDHVETEQDGNVKTGFINRNVLPAVDFVRLGNPKNRAGAVFAHDILCSHACLLEFRKWKARNLRELRDFLLERHLPQQVTRVGLRLPECRRAANRRHQKQHESHEDRSTTERRTEPHSRSPVRQLPARDYTHIAKTRVSL